MRYLFSRTNMLPQLQAGKIKGLVRFLTAQNAALLVSLLIYYCLSRTVNWRERVFQRQLIDHGHLLYWEKRLGWLVLALSAERLWRRSTLDQFLSDMSFYLRAMSCFVLVCADWRRGVYLLLWNLLSFLLLPQQRYAGPSKVELLNPASLDRQAMSESSKETWLVMLTAPWSSKSRHAQHTFAELSQEYSSNNLRFGELEVSRWPKVAVKFDVNIESIPHQLPSFLLFQRGKVVKRLPAKDENWERWLRLRTILVGHFELDMLMAKEM